MQISRSICNSVSTARDVKDETGRVNDPKAAKQAAASGGAGGGKAARAKRREEWEQRLIEDGEDPGRWRECSCDVHLCSFL
jgi:hypothetical protein